MSLEQPELLLASFYFKKENGSTRRKILEAQKRRTARIRVARFPGPKKAKLTFKKSQKKPNTKIEAGSCALVIIALFA